MTEIGDTHAPINILERLAKSGAPLIVADSSDLEWIDILAQRLGERLDRPAYRWSLASGLVPLLLTGIGNKAVRRPEQVIEYLAGADTAAIVVMTDIAYALEDDVARSALRDLARAADDTGHTLILPGFGLTLPADIRNYAAPFDPGLPNTDQLKELVIDEATIWSNRNQQRAKVSKSSLDSLIRNVLGLTRTEARRVVRMAVADGALDETDMPMVIKAKHELLAQGGVLSFEPHTEKLANVAGMDRLKKWLSHRKESFLSEKPLRGLDRPKGILLLGVQGGGKSLLAKAVAGVWGVPLLKMDMGALYNKYHGETERNLRESLRAADVMSPCVLWIDEIEKGIAGDDNDGLSKRVLGTLLTWMAERKSRAFLVATANNIEILPPELLRKGRFDEIFFVDLPDAAVRGEIFRIHLRKREQDPTAFDIEQLENASEGFAGAEIEQVVVAALYASHADNEPLNTKHIVAEIKKTRPLSILMAEKIASLRDWAENRTVPA
ncbi:AAA family ATPase [Sedimenticola sp.]|uniref:AAA family ATPase n=1 Tax=Sedimenticola sp. TaxID=1940285 RepID=UPI003D12B467